MSSLLGLIPTIDNEGDLIPVNEDTSDSDEEGIKIRPMKKSKKKTNKNKQEEFNEQFEFCDSDNELDLLLSGSDINIPKNEFVSSTLDEKISEIRKQHLKTKLKGQNGGPDAVIKDSYDDDEMEAVSDEENLENVKTDSVRVKEKKKKKTKKRSAGEEIDMDGPKIKYEDEITTFDEQNDFNDMNLSRPLMKSLTGLGWLKPTPIQIATIPVALLGKDICACAATGTGKTGAFMLPVLERLLYRPKRSPVTRVLVITPTRELGLQIFEVSRQLAQYTNIEVAHCIGGLDQKAQEAALRLSPDVVIATPGRLIDNVLNAPSFNLNSVEILILDEADRMLDEFFQEQMKKIFAEMSRSRQTMLFSATMTEQVKVLAAASLNNPVKVYVNQNVDMALNLHQEFIRIRENREGDREAIVAALIKRTFHDHCLVFIQTKKHAHRMHVILGLLGVKCGELHGNLTQPQRIEALRLFKAAELDVLIVTDLVSRGLDIEGVKTVINFTMPNTVQHYIHRVGRTARAGKSGRAVTLVGEKEKKYLKEVTKRATLPSKSRIVPPEIITHYRDRIQELEKDITDIERMELEEKEMRVTELKVNKAQKMIEHHDEIMSRPKRTWFQTHHERKLDEESQQLTKRESIKGKTKMKKAITPTDRIEFDLMKAAAYSARVAKKSFKEKRIRACAEDYTPAKKKAKTSKSSFSKELTSTGSKALRQYRKGDSNEGGGKKKYGDKQKRGGSKPSRGRPPRR